MDDKEPRRDHLKQNLSCWFEFVNNTADAGRQLEFYDEHWHERPTRSFPKFILNADDAAKTKFDAAYLAWCLLD